MHVRYTPTSTHIGQVEFKGEVRSVISANADFLHLKRISRHDKSHRRFNIAEEVRDYETMKNWNAS